ncbi:MAG: Mur ligase family protein [[Clostridium] leptum]
MKKFFVILVCKTIRLIGRLTGRGSSLPGQIALKLDPDILSKIKMPPYIVAVTGSNGKTSTVELIARILKDAGKSFAYNKEGSNQIEGVTTLILEHCTFSGKVKPEIILIESDERFAKYTFRYFSPTHYIITNLYRDQLTRNGHPEWVAHAIEESIRPETQLVLNADDPLVSKFGRTGQHRLFRSGQASPIHRQLHLPLQ